jgi:putative ABC transport system permease protein
LLDILITLKTTCTMFRNYIFSAYRNLLKTRFYSLLNILGLSLGFSAVIFILLFVNDELNYDKHNLKHERIYRVHSAFKIGEMDDNFAITALPLGPAFKLEFPEVQEMVRIARINDLLIKVENKEYYETQFFLVDSTIFDIFTNEFIYGQPENALTEINSLVITESLSRKYFGDQNPIGEVVESGLNVPLKITGVIKDLPMNSHILYEGLISIITGVQGPVEDFNSFEAERFWSVNLFTFVLLNENTDIDALSQKFPAFYEKYMKSVGDQINATFTPVLTPLADMHLYNRLKADLPTGNIAYVYIFVAVGIFILLLAAINYMNMATARSARRAREVGIRKVVGAHRGQLIAQFLTESFMMVFVAVIIALALVGICIDDFNELAGKKITMELLTEPFIIFILSSIAFVLALLSGSYPAFYLSSFLPVKVLRGSLSSGGRNSGWLRRILVVLQFTIAISLIIGTMVVNDQLRYLKNKDLGFDKENLVVLQLQDTSFRNKVIPFREALLQHPAILSVTNANGVPGRSNQKTVMRIESEEGWKDHAIMLTQADYNYLDVLNIKLTDGRNFDRNMGSDATEAAIINQAFARQYGWDEPLGKKIHYDFEIDGSGGRILKVIGVVADYHIQSLHNPIEPYVIMLNTRPAFMLLLKVRGQNFSETLAFTQTEWDHFASGKPFDYKLLENMLSEDYRNESRIGMIFELAALLTVFIALLGLLGLSSYVAEQKTKEIGIRKILGASVGNLMKMLYSELGLLILIAFVLAVPLAWWRLEIWLESSFVYHTDINPLSFLVAGIAAFLVGLLTISFHLLKVVRSNPVEAIKFE